MRALFILVVVPFFSFAQITTHSRGAGMGDAGIAAASGNQQLGYNIGKTVFTHHLHQASVTYLPWMRALFADTKFIRADYLTTMGESTTLGMAVNYLDMGNLTTRDNNGASLAIYRNTAFSIGGSVGVKISESAGIGATLKLAGARAFETGPTHRYGVSAELHYYQSMGKFSLGAVVNHIGNPLWQTGEIGIGLVYGDQTESTEWMVAMDVRKPFHGSFSSMRYSLGGEMGFAESFFIRSGVQLEQPIAGNRKFISLGVGYNGFVLDQSWGVDLHYLLPFGNRASVSALQHSMGLSLNLNIGNFK